MKLDEQHEWIRKHQSGTILIKDSKAPEKAFDFALDITDAQRGQPRKWSRFTHNLTLPKDAV